MSLLRDLVIVGSFFYGIALGSLRARRGLPASVIQRRQDENSLLGHALLTDEQQRIICTLKERLASYYGLPSTAEEVFQRSRHVRCAVVGNSGAQIEHRNGAEINGHDVVIRLNDAPTVGFEDIVGNHTTFRFGWNTCDPRRNCKTPTAIPDAPALWPPAFYGVYAKDVKESHINVLRSLYPKIAATVKRGEDNPTTGFYGMLLALTNCWDVDAYDMVPSDASNWSTYSYYREGTAGEALIPPHQHPYLEAEHDLWSRLSIVADDLRRQTGKTSYLGFSRCACRSTTKDD